MADQIPNDDKFRELLLLIARESEGDDSFGAIKLNKLLFYADFRAYVKFGKSITGQLYQRLTNGPAPRKLLPIRREMIRNRECAIATRDYFGRNQKRVIALREPDLSEFTGDEVSLVQNVIRDFWEKDAKQMSDKSHRFIGWKLAKENETIPYDVALVARGPRNRKAEQAAKQLESLAQECLSRGKS